VARMYPTRLAEDTESPAERRLYRELERQLPNDYVVMHGVKWLNRHARYERHDSHGEADFVIAHPRRGILVIEVKGGAIAGAWADDTWTSTSAGGYVHQIKNPFRQAERAYWALSAKLAENPATSPYRYPMFKGVAFPDMLIRGTNLGIDWDRQLALDSSDLNVLAAAVDRMYGKDPQHQPLPKAAIDALVSLLQPTLVLDRPGLVADVLAGEDVILRLSEEQVRLLDLLRNQRQAVIDGCAGSGKTMLAVEKTLQLAGEGFSVLLTCFNKSLAAWMQGVIDLSGRAVAGKVRVSHYHDLAVKLCEEAGHPTTVRPGDQAYWDDDLPDDLLAALPDLETRFDAIVVDEGQDFRDNWWVTIQELLADPKQGVFYIFQDQHQAIYQRTSDLPITSPPFPLGHNYRSTNAIHARVIEFYDGDPKPGSIGPAGRPVEQVTPAGKGVVDDVRRALARLLGEEGLQPGQVVILTPYGREKSALKEGERLAGISLTWGWAPGARQVRVSSIHGFKGLESDVVILAELEALARMPARDRLCYVAMSRAKHHLITIGPVPSIGLVG